MRVIRNFFLLALTFLASHAWAGSGQGLYLQNCVLCHQANAMGLQGQFPRLAGRVSVIAAQPAGREYLIDVLTYGLAGTLKLDGQSITGVMPPFSTLPNDTVADILSYVETLGQQPAREPMPFTEQEVAAGRKAQKSMENVQSERQALQAAKVIE